MYTSKTSEIRSIIVNTKAAAETEVAGAIAGQLKPQGSGDTKMEYKTILKNALDRHARTEEKTALLDTVHAKILTYEKEKGNHDTVLSDRQFRTFVQTAVKELSEKKDFALMDKSAIAQPTPQVVPKTTQQPIVSVGQGTKPIAQQTPQKLAEAPKKPAAMIKETASDKPTQETPLRGSKAPARKLSIDAEAQSDIKTFESPQPQPVAEVKEKATNKFAGLGNDAILKHFETEKEYPKVVPFSQKLPLTAKLASDLSQLSPEQMDHLSKHESFWTLITNDNYKGVADIDYPVSSLSPECLEILAKNATKMQRPQLNAIVLVLSDKDKDKLEDQLRALAKSGADFSDNFKIKVNRIGGNKKTEILKIWNESKLNVKKAEDEKKLQFIDEQKQIKEKAIADGTYIEPKAEVKHKTVDTHATPDAIIYPDRIAWNPDDIKDFIEKDLEHLNEQDGRLNEQEILEKLQTMDDKALIQFTKSLNTTKQLHNFWFIENLDTNAKHYRIARIDRLEIIFSNMDDTQIKESAQKPNFWKIINNKLYNEAAGKGFSDHQIGLIMSEFMPQVMSTKLDKFTFTMNFFNCIAAYMMKIPTNGTSEERALSRSRINNIDSLVPKKRADFPYLSQKQFDECLKYINDSIEKQTTALDQNKLANGHTDTVKV